MDDDKWMIYPQKNLLNKYSKQHLCSYKLDESNLDIYEALVRDGKFVFKHCRRVSAYSENLSGPEPL